MYYNKAIRRPIWLLALLLVIGSSTLSTKATNYTAPVYYGTVLYQNDCIFSGGNGDSYVCLWPDDYDGSGHVIDMSLYLQTRDPFGIFENVWRSLYDNYGYGTHEPQDHDFVDGGGFVQMQQDGNFVLYDSNATPHWATNTQYYTAWLNVQDDGNMVVYTPSPGNIGLWSLF